MLDGIAVPDVGLGLGWVIATIYTLALLRGALIPRKTHEDALHDRDEWRAEGRLKDAQIAEKDVQLGHLAEVGRTVEAAMTAIQNNARATGGTP